MGRIQFEPRFCGVVPPENFKPVGGIDWSKVKLVQASAPKPGATLDQAVIRLVTGGEPLSIRKSGISSNLGGNA